MITTAGDLFALLDERTRLQDQIARAERSLGNGGNAQTMTAKHRFFEDAKAELKALEARVIFGKQEDEL